VPVDLDKYRESSHDSWERIATNWDQEREFIHSATAPVNERMVERLDPQPGDTVLDLAAGTGDTGFLAAARIGDDGKLISTDCASAMVDSARGVSTQLELGNVEHRVLDAEQMDLDDSSVDRVLCRFGYMLMADPTAAFAETRRVLRPGGRLTLAVWGALERNPFFAIIGISLVQRGHIPPPEPPPAPGPFSMASVERLEGLLRDAGFAEVRVEEVHGRFLIPDVDEYLSVIADTAGPIALALQGLEEADLAPVRADVEDSLDRFANEGGYELPAVALCAVAS
jgi:SAM-dependent methyltransferase